MINVLTTLLIVLTSFLVGLCFNFHLHLRTFFDLFLDFFNDPFIHYATVYCVIFKNFSVLF